MRKLKLFALFAAMLFATSTWATIPIGSVDGVTGGNGSFRVWGWALDPDQPSTAVTIHVYIYPQGNTNPVKGYNATVANLNRPDLNNGDPNSIGAQYGTVHGFDCWIDITSDVPAGTYDVRVWPINVGSNEGNHTITYSGNGGEVKTITISNPYTVSYNANGGTGAPSAQRKVTGINITLSNTTPTRTGYTFNGWNTNNSGTGTNYAKGATYSANASATLYAKWTANKYTVTFNQQSGTGGSSSVQATYASAMPSATMPTRTGYTFQGYYDATSGGTKYYNANGSSAKNWDKTANATLYARWTANTYKVKFNGNGNTGGSMSDQNFTYGTAQNLTANAFSRTGYTFAGWATSSDGAKAYNDKQSVNNLTATNGGTFNLYAVWTPMTYTTGSWMRVGYNTGRTNTPNATSGAISYKGFNGNTGGWGAISYIEDPNRGIGYQAAGNGKNNERKGVYSIYKNEQTIPSYSKRRITGTFTLASSDAKYKSTAALYAHNNQSELEYYSVDFTHGLNDGTGSSKRITYVVNETKNGSWQSNSANYTYDFDNSTGSAEVTKGWYILLAHTIVTDAAYDNGVAEKASFKSTSENYTWYYYKYVTFDPNGGTGNMDVQTVENSAQLHHNAFSRTGYSFAGWNTQPDGNGTSYANEAVMTATVDSKGPVTLYAQWTVNQYTISYDLAGGEVSTANPANYTIETATFTLNNPTKANNTFLGWTGSNGETPQMEVSIAKGSTGDKNFVANWQENQAPEEPATSGIFDYNYDCSRNPAYPTKGNSCNLSGFSNPCVGLAGIGCGMGNNSAGPWKLEYVEMWNIDNSAYASATTSQAYYLLQDYFSNVPDYYDDPQAFYAYAHEKLPVFSLSQWNGSAYQFVCYGFVCAYAGLGNTVEHAALFVSAGNDYGCFLSGHEHSGNLNLTFDTDLVDGLQGLMPSGGGSSEPSTPNSITINGTPQVGDNSISLTYYFDPANVPGLSDFAPTLKVKCVTDNVWDEEWLDLYNISSNTKTINLSNLGTFKAGKAYEICFAYYNGSWVDEPFQSFSFPAEEPQDPGDQTIYAGFTATDGCGGFGGEDHTKLVDGKFTSGNEGVDWTKWCADSQHKSVPSGESESCWWVDFNAANPIAVTGYILTTGNDNIPHGAGRNPSSWIIKAKLNESDSWTTIATVSNDNTMQVANFTDFAFTLDQAGTYKYFRFMVSAPVSGTCMQLCELRFTGSGSSEPADPEALKLELLQELWTALGEDVWTGYGTQTGVISYSRGGAEAFHASFMGGNYAFDLPFAAFTNAEKAANTDGSYTYTLTCNLPAQTGMGQETLHVTVKNGEIEGLHSDNAGIDMTKEEEVTGWAALQAKLNAGGMVKLGANVTAAANEAALEIPQDVTVVIDLNGHTINRGLASAAANGSVIVNNGTLAIMGEGAIVGGNTTGNGGGILNNGILTLYGGEIKNNHANIGGGVYNNSEFWMTAGLIKENTANSNAAIGGNVIFNEQAMVQIDAQGTKVSVATALANMADYNYVQPVMPSYDDLQPADPEALKLELLQELWTALGEDVWTGYGTQTGVISYSRGGQEAFHASFMGGNYAFDLPFAAFTAAEKAANTDGSYTYTLTCNLPAQTGMGQETLHVTVKNGEIEGLHSDNAGIDMTKEEEVTGWAALQAKLNAGGMVKLGANVTAAANEAALVVPQDVTVVIDLNGHTINRGLQSAAANGSVLVNDGTLAIMGEGAIVGGNTTGNGGGILNNGILTLYGGEIKNNHANIGGGVYSSNNAQFWMTAGLIKENEATTNAAIGGNVIFNEQAQIQINANGDKITVANALTQLASLTYVQPVMPSYDDLQPADPEALKLELLQELWTALGEDIWTGYGTQTGVISYSRGGQEAFHASFMGGNYAFDLPFAAFTNAEKAANTDDSYTYTLTCNLPAQTGMGQETLHVTVKNGEIEGLHSDNAGIDMTKEEEVTGWAALQAKLNAGGMVKLGADVEAPANAAALNIPQDVTVVIDLNGHTINRGLASAAANGSVLVNDGTLAIMGEGAIVGGNTTGNGGGILNNGILTLYGGEIKNNHANIGGGVYSTENAQFWMTAGLIKDNEAGSYAAIGGNVIFNEQAQIQINENGDKITVANALTQLASLTYVQPVMPSYDDLQPADPEALKLELLQELWTALGEDVWTGYGTQTGVISYCRGGQEAFHASFMGGNYAFDLPFAAFTNAEKAANTDGSYTYTLTCNLPAQTGMGQETLHVTVKNGEITELESENAGVELQKETDGTIATWAELQNALNQGGVIKLTNDIVGGDAPLEIPAGKTVVLDLNGHTINRGMTSADTNGSVIVNNGTLAIVDNSELANGVITGGKTTGNGGGVLNNGIFTLYAGEITGNEATIGGGVYNNGGAQGFWMTGGLIDGNTATTSNPAIGGDVIFNNMAQIQINADGDKVSIDDALAGLTTYTYIKPVMPSYDDYTTEVAITANEDPENQGSVYYSTFYDSANKYMLPAGVEAYVADLSGSDLVLTRIAVAGQVIPADEAVILKANVQNFNLIPSFDAPVSVSANNDLEGVDLATPLADLGIDKEKCYVLSGTTQYGVGFYKINATMLKAHKAYVIYNGTPGFAPKRMRFVFNQEQTATGVENVQPSDIRSQKVLENGILYIIKNGVRYNVQGQIVK